MKITDVKMEKFSIELTEPFKVAFAEVSHTVSIIVKVETDEGYVGYGRRRPLDRLPEKLQKDVWKCCRCSARDLLV